MPLPPEISEFEQANEITDQHSVSEEGGYRSIIC